MHKMQGNLKVTFKFTNKNYFETQFLHFLLTIADENQIIAQV